MQKSSDFDKRLRHYTKNSYGSQKVCKKSPEFDVN